MKHKENGSSPTEDIPLVDSKDDSDNKSDHTVVSGKRI